LAKLKFKLIKIKSWFDCQKDSVPIAAPWCLITSWRIRIWVSLTSVTTEALLCELLSCVYKLSLGYEYSCRSIACILPVYCGSYGDVSWNVFYLLKQKSI